MDRTLIARAMILDGSGADGIGGADRPPNLDQSLSLP
jgi:hypothetical protein